MITTEKQSRDVQVLQNVFMISFMGLTIVMCLSLVFYRNVLKNLFPIFILIAAVLYVPLSIVLLEGILVTSNDMTKYELRLGTKIRSIS